MCPLYITYISVSKSNPLAVTAPHGQLASFLLQQSCNAKWAEVYIVDE